MIVFFDNPAFVKAFIACCILSVSSGFLGVFLLLRRMTLIGDALSHGLLPGVALGFLIIPSSVIAMSLGGLVAGLLLACGVGWISLRQKKLQEDATFSGFYLVAMALGVILLSHHDHELLHILFGAPENISWLSLSMMLGGAFLTLFFFARYFNAFVILCFDPIFFQCQGGDPTKLTLLFLGIFTVNCVLAFQALGTLMVLGIFILPALTARLLTSQLQGMIYGAIGFSLVGSLLGLIISVLYGTEMGPTIVLVLGAFYGGAVLVSMRKAKAIP